MDENISLKAKIFKYVQSLLFSSFNSGLGRLHPSTQHAVQVFKLELFLNLNCTCLDRCYKESAVKSSLHTKDHQPLSASVGGPDVLTPLTQEAVPITVQQPPSSLEPKKKICSVDTNTKFSGTHTNFIEML